MQAVRADQQVAARGGAVGEMGGHAGRRAGAAGEPLAVRERDATPLDLGAQGPVEVGAADRRGGDAVRVGAAQGQPGQPAARGVAQVQGGRREAGGEDPGRVEAERAEGGQAVHGDGDERAALVGPGVAGFVDGRGEPGVVQGEGGDGAGDAATRDHGCLSHRMNMHLMTSVRQPRETPRLGP
ncbi:hypothetical protein GCM10020358_25540 [Amorphoplanes nipponensis]